MPYSIITLEIWKKHKADNSTAQVTISDGKEIVLCADVSLAEGLEAIRKYVEKANG